MKKQFLLVLFLFILVILGTFLIFEKKSNENDNLTKIKVAEVAHSIFYAPQYVAL